MLELNKENFKSEIEDYKGVSLVDFWASWCGPCQMASPILEEVAKEMTGKAKFAKLNVDDSQEVASRFGVMSIPTFIFFQDGQEVDRKIGLLEKEEIKANIEKLLEK